MKRNSVSVIYARWTIKFFTSNCKKIMSKRTQKVQQNKTQMSCPVCFGEKEMISTKCNHQVCQQCYESILIDKNQCPMCRQAMVPTEDFETAKNMNTNMNLLIQKQIVTETKHVDIVLFQKVLDKVVKITWDSYPFDDYFYHFYGNDELMEIFFTSPKGKGHLTQILNKKYTLDKDMDMFLAIFTREHYLEETVRRTSHHKYMNRLKMVIRIIKDENEFDKSIQKAIKTMANSNKFFEILEYVHILFDGKFDDLVLHELLRENNVQGLEYLKFLNFDKFEIIVGKIEEDVDEWYMETKMARFLSERITSLNRTQFELLIYESDFNVFKRLLNIFTIEKALQVDVINLTEHMEESERIDNYFVEKCEEYFKNKE